MSNIDVSGWRYAAKCEDGMRLHPSIRPNHDLSEGERDKACNTVAAVAATA
jgi:hypothetical protein